MKLLRYFHTFYSVLIFGIFAIFALPIYFIGFGLFGQKAASVVMSYNRFWVRTWGFLSGVRYHSVYEERINPKQAYVYIANHRALADIFVVAAVIPGVFHPLMKAEAGKYPIMGYLFKQFCVMVDRKSGGSRQQSLLQLKERVKRGNSILVFPEGTRNRSNEILLNPFYAGAFRIAIDLQIPVVPVTFLGTRDVFPNNQFLIHPATITCVFGQPIQTEGLQSKDTERLKEESFDAIERVLLENQLPSA